MTRGEQRSTVRLLIGESEEQFYLDTEINTQIDAANLMVARDYLANITFYDIQGVLGYNDVSLTPTDNRREGRYPLSQDFLSIKGVQLQDSGIWYPQLKELSWDKFAAFSRSPTGGIPRFYKIEMGAVSVDNPFPGDIWLWPYPDKYYKIRITHYQKPTPLLDDNQTTELPEVCHFAACCWAAMIVSRKGKDRGVMAECATLWQSEKDSLLRYKGQRDLSGDMEMEDVYGAG